jgi:hypothetical protein
MRTFFCTMLSLLLVACVTTRQAALPIPGYGIDGVRAGDTVVVELSSGERHRFEVRSTDAVGINGWGESYAYTDMHSVEVVEKNDHGTAIIWALLGISLFVALSALDPINFGFPPTGPFCVRASGDPYTDC